MRRESGAEILARLNVLEGNWALSAMLEGTEVSGGSTSFRWNEDGKFLIQRAERDDDAAPDNVPQERLENAPEPVTTIIGLDDTSEQFTMLYADARNVFRVYQMILSDGVWTIWRTAPGFSQRFTGIFSEDHRTINGRWEVSEDGVNWNVDFELTYRRTSGS